MRVQCLGPQGFGGSTNPSQANPAVVVVVAILAWNLDSEHKGPKTLNPKTLNPQTLNPKSRAIDYTIDSEHKLEQMLNDIHRNFLLKPKVPLPRFRLLLRV